MVPQHERKKRSQAEMLNGLPEEEVLLELPEDQLVCGKCGGKMKPIGKKFLRHEMQIIPKQMKLLAYYAVTYACNSCITPSPLTASSPTSFLPTGCLCSSTIMVCQP